MQLTPPEKLILTMLAQIHKHCGITDSNAELVADAIDRDFLWALSLQYGETKLPKDVDRVWKILTMWYNIETSYKKLSDDDKKQIKKETNLSEDYFKFHGFDGNHELNDYSIAMFLIEKLDMFGHFKSRKLDDTVRLAEYYNAMLVVYKPIKENGSYLTVKTIIALINAGIKS